MPRPTVEGSRAGRAAEAAFAAPRWGSLGLVMERAPGQALDAWAETESTTFPRVRPVLERWFAAP